MRSVVICAMGVAVLLSMACVAGADPYPDQVPKFSQLPMIATPIPTQVEPGMFTDVIYYGHDELSTAWDWDPYDGQEVYDGRFMADDFADTFNTPVVHIRWWGSYMNREQVGDERRVERFVIAFENDIPAEPGREPYPFSHPDCWDSPLNSQISIRDADGATMPMPGMFTEKLIRGPDPILGESLYEYNAELEIPFPQEKDTVYWLKIVALVDHDDQMGLPPLEWGWHNRDYTVWDPLASTRPNVIPGEDVQGWLDPGTPDFPEDDIPIWHFQDDAVSGSIENVAVVDPTAEHPDVHVHMDQDHWVQEVPSLIDEHYWGYIDGPEEIAQYSKDLAFELFTLPDISLEPGDCDGDGDIDWDDFLSFSSGWFGLEGAGWNGITPAPLAYWSTGDFTLPTDHDVDWDDFLSSRVVGMDPTVPDSLRLLECPNRAP